MIKKYVVEIGYGTKVAFTNLEDAVNLVKQLELGVEIRPEYRKGGIGVFKADTADFLIKPMQCMDQEEFDALSDSEEA